MTQLVLHTGTPTSLGPEIRSKLAAWRHPLGVGAVAMPHQDGESAWNRVVEQLTTSGTSRQRNQALTKLVSQSVRQGFETILLSSESGFLPLRKGKNVQALLAYCRENDVSCKVVLVVREQLDLLNALYCRQVMGMETSAGFEEFLAKPMASRRYHYAQAFRALLDAEGIDVVAVPYSRLSRAASVADAARTILVAAGLAAETVEALPMPEQQTVPTDLETLPGPVLVAATRMLQKRLARLGIDRSHRSRILVRAGSLLREHAEARGWDETEFWGWSADLAAAATQSYRPGNAEFAAGVWRDDWPDPPTSRSTTRLDLPSQSPALVVDLMDALQRVIDEALAGPGEHLVDDPAARAGRA